MTEELKNKLNLYKESILYLKFNSFDNMSKEEIKKHFDKSINSIKSILNNLQDEKNIEIFINIINEIKSEIRIELIKECQSKAAIMNQYGIQYIETEDNNPILIRYYLIELCEDVIKEVLNPQDEEEIEETNTNKIYLYSSKMPQSKNDFKSLKIIREDLESIPTVYYESFQNLIEEMRSGICDGRQHKCKVLKNSKLGDTFEHRAYHGVRLYENTIETFNNKIRKKIKSLERELGAEIHFVYKLEIKKCDKTNGLDEEREKRYKNENSNYEELVESITADEIRRLADETYEVLNRYLEDNKKDKTEEEIDEEIAVYTVLDIINAHLHKDYELKDDNFEFEFTEERAIENERCQIFLRLITYLNTKSIDELRELSIVFNLIDEIINNSDNSYTTDKEKKNQAELEKDKIISLIMYLLRDISLEELKEKEIEILMIIDHKEEYKTKIEEKKEEKKHEKKN